MDAPECAQAFERAQLWSVYFALRGLAHPPSYLCEAERRLHEDLVAEESEEVSSGVTSPPVARAGNLSLVVSR